MRNISFDATENDLRKLFEEAGEINSIKMLTGKAFIRYTDPEGQQKALLLNGKKLNDRYLKVDLPLNLNNNNKYLRRPNPNR